MEHKYLTLVLEQAKIITDAIDGSDDDIYYVTSVGTMLATAIASVADELRALRFESDEEQIYAGPPYKF